jgi:hypothetical protein
MSEWPVWLACGVLAMGCGSSGSGGPKPCSEEACAGEAGHAGDADSPAGEGGSGEKTAGAGGEGGRETEEGGRAFGGASEAGAGAGPDTGEGPTVSIAFPTPVSATDAHVLTVRGRAEDAQGVTKVVVGGLDVETDDDYATWRVDVPLELGENDLVFMATDGEGHVTKQAARVQVTRTGTPLLGVRSLAVDAARNRLVIVEDEHVLMSASLDDGVVEPFSDKNHGTGEPFEIIETVVVDALNDRFVVLDWGADALLAVDPATGNRSVISAAGTDEATTLSLGNGVALDSTSSFAYVTVAATNAVVRVALDSGERTVVSSPTLGGGAIFDNPTGIVIDELTDPLQPRLLVSDSQLHAVMAVDLTTGDRSVFSRDAAFGHGPSLDAPIGLTLDADNDRLLLVDAGLEVDALFSISLASGDRTVLANGSTGSGPALDDPLWVTLDAAAQRAYVAGYTGGRIVAVDLDSGKRTDFVPAGVGAGPQLKAPAGLSYLANATGAGKLLLCDSSLGAVFSVDLETAERTIVSGVGVGTGTALDFPTDTALDTTTEGEGQRLLVVDAELQALVGVNLSTGERHVVSSPFVGDGPILLRPSHLDLDTSQGRVLVTDAPVNDPNGVFAIDLASGDRTLVSSIDRGSGNELGFARAIVLDRTNAASGRAFVTEGDHTVLLSLDLESGDRSVFSEYPSPGSGVAISYPGDMVLDQRNERLLVADQLKDAIMGVAVATGNRVVLSGGNDNTPGITGSGPRVSAWALTLHDTEDVAFAVTANMLLAVDLVSGDRVIVTR